MISRAVPSNKVSGMGLIEVLVAAVIIAIGLLGLAGLQTRSLQMNQSAHFRSQASYYANEIIDAMRMDVQGARNGNYDVAMSDGPPGTGNVADAAVSRWIQGIEAALPMGAPSETGGSVSVNTGGTGTTATVTVAWLDARWSDDASDRIRSITISREL